ncbi:hypothetical protein CCE01nite_30190 [Cellulomonas cellasea]|uniref:Uncharacterized protein n=1 Tax=Cellulomonas cellasea TaxID=43670 RepID=A0A4Y3L1Q8_9CELL|nr:hypothetical protein CCE01nite_30190 [Cellulomonas cellasea]
MTDEYVYAVLAEEWRDEEPEATRLNPPSGRGVTCTSHGFTDRATGTAPRQRAAVGHLRQGGLAEERF